MALKGIMEHGLSRERGDLIPEKRALHEENCLSTWPNAEGKRKSLTGVEKTSVGSQEQIGVLWGHTVGVCLGRFSGTVVLFGGGLCLLSLVCAMMLYPRTVFMLVLLKISFSLQHIRCGTFTA